MGVSTPPRKASSVGGRDSVAPVRLIVVAVSFFALGFVIGALADEPPPDPGAEKRVAAVEAKAAALRSRADGEAGR
jgi:hypothetical protein